MTPSKPAIGTIADHRVAVALTFDFDAESGWTGTYGIDTPSAMSRGAYGSTEGVPRVLRLLEKYQLPATFFIPGDTANRHPSQTKAIVAAGHELGHHGYAHESPSTLTRSEERAALERGFEALERQTGQRPRGYRAPAWEASNNTYSLLQEFGIEYDASQVGADRPYWVSDGGLLTSLVEIPGAWEFCDTALFRFNYDPYMTGLKSPGDVWEIWQGDFDGMYAEDSDATLVLTLHPEIIGRHHRMALLEDFIRHMSALDGVWFAQMGDIADHFRSRATT